MSFLSLCPDDPFVTTLRDLFGANIVRVPEERIKPLEVVAHRNERASLRGSLAPLVMGEPKLNFSAANFVTSAMADVSGKRSRKVKLKFGLQVLDGFLQGFHVPTAGVHAQLEGAFEVSFSFSNVQRTYVDNNWLGGTLTNRALNPRDPAAAIFFGNDQYALYVIDSIITSSDFSISVDRSAGQNLRLDVPSIQAVITQAKVDVKVSTSTGYDLIFQGNKHLSFAFSCVRLSLDEQGTIISMPPEFGDVGLGHNALPDTGSPHPPFSPDHVLLHEQPGMLDWEE